MATRTKKQNDITYLAEETILKKLWSFARWPPTAHISKLYGIRRMQHSLITATKLHESWHFFLHHATSKYRENYIFGATVEPKCTTTKHVCRKMRQEPYQHTSVHARVSKRCNYWWLYIVSHIDRVVKEQWLSRHPELLKQFLSLPLWIKLYVRRVSLSAVQTSNSSMIMSAYLASVIESIALPIRNSPSTEGKLPAVAVRVGGRDEKEI